MERIALDAEILDPKADAGPDAKGEAKAGRKGAGKARAKAAGASQPKRARRAVSVKIGGQEYRIRSGASEAWLRKVAACVDDAMGQIREKTDTVDSLDVALLTALNLARQVIQLREAQLDGLGEPSEAEREAEAEGLRDLIQRVEAALEEGPEAGRGADPSSRP